MVFYEYVCRCDCRYVGCTSLRLEERINQHVPNFIRRKQQPTKILPERRCKIRSIPTHQQCGSAIGLHLMQNPECAIQYSNDQFSILAKAIFMIFLCIYMKNISKNLDSNLEKQGQIVKSQKKKKKTYIQRNDKITIHFSLFTRFVLFKQGPAVFYSNGVRYSLLF